MNYHFVATDRSLSIIQSGSDGLIVANQEFGDIEAVHVPLVLKELLHSFETKMGYETTESRQVEALKLVHDLMKEVSDMQGLLK